MQKQALRTVVTDHPYLEEFFREFRHPGLSAGPVFLVDPDRAAAQGTVLALLKNSTKTMKAVGNLDQTLLLCIGCLPSLRFGSFGFSVGRRRGRPQSAPSF
jgi:hypothetical protein